MSEIIIDLPIGKDGESKFAFSVYKQAMVKLIVDSNPQFTIGIFGKWGTGKSTLMKLIEEDLMEIETCIPIFYNPWRFENDDNLLVSMLQTVKYKLSSTKRYESSIKKIGRSITALMRASKVKVGFDNFGYEFSGKDAVGSEKEVDYFEDLYKITDLLKDAVPKGKRIVIFIDDLDRCLPDKALNLFNSIKSFMDISGYIFVIGLDQDVVINAINERYKKEDSFGESYVNKIIQIPFYLPFIKTTELPAYISTFPLQKGLKEIISEVIDGMDTNPREIKRLINSYILQREIVKSDKNKVLSPYRDEKNLLKFILIQFRWKKFYDDMVGYHPEFAQTVVKVISSEADKDNYLNENQTLKQHFEDRALYQFVESNIDIFKNVDEMEDYFYFTKASIGTNLDRNDVNVLWNDIISNEKIKIDSILNNVSSINQRVLLHKIEDELVKISLPLGTAINVVKIILKFESIDIRGIIKLLISNTEEYRSNGEYLELLELMGDYHQDQISLIEKELDNYNKPEHLYQLLNVLKKNKDKRSSELIGKIQLNNLNGDIDSFMDYILENPDKAKDFPVKTQDFKEVQIFLDLVDKAKKNKDKDYQVILRNESRIKQSRKVVKRFMNHYLNDDPNLAIILCSILLKNKDLEIRKFSAICLGKVGGEKEFRLIREVLPKNKSKKVRSSLRAAEDKILKRLKL